MRTTLLLSLTLAACATDAHRAPSASPTHPEPTADTDRHDDGDTDEPMHDPQENAEGVDLPAGTDVTWPANREVAATLAAILESGADPILQFDHTRDGSRFNVLVPVPADGRVDDARGWSVRVDLGALEVIVSDFADSTDPTPRLVAPGGGPEGLVVLKAYTRQGPAGGPDGAPRLDILGLFDGASPEAAPLDSFDLAAGPPPLDCDGQAWVDAGPLPPLTVVMPPLSHCDLGDCVDTKVAWIQANHDVLRVRQMLDFIASEPDGELREWWWSQPGRTAGGFDNGEASSLAWWFGAYAGYRFDAIRWTYNQLWSDLHDLNLGGLALDLECRPAPDADICNTAAPAAHHAVKSNLKLCDRFFDDKDDNDRRRLIVHETLHHVFVPWNDVGPRLDPLMDTHTHGHGSLCLTNVVTDKGYGVTAIRELASYSNGNGDCWHQNYAFRNNDTYAYAAMEIGRRVQDGSTYAWPAQFYPDGWEWPHSYDVEACQGFQPAPAPGDEWYDPLNDCVKVGWELICPPAGGGGGGLSSEFDIGIECPEF